MKKLLECIPNIGLTCSTCNQSFKRVGEKYRALPTTVVQSFEAGSKCEPSKRKQCRVPCKALRSLQKAYSRMREAEIILQPMGVMGAETKEALELQYDVMRMEFQPCTNKHIYSNKEIDFIWKHINRFHLNDPQYRTRELYDFIVSVIDNGGSVGNNSYDNMIVDIFANKLKEKSEKEALKICESIYICVFTIF